MASSASPSGQRCGFSSMSLASPSSSSYAKSLSRNSRDSNRPASSSSSPLRCLEGRFQGDSSFAQVAVFSHVGVTSLASQGGHLPLPLFVLLDGQGSGTMGDRGAEVGISSPLFIASSSLSGSDFPAKLLPYLFQGLALHGEVSALLALGVRPTSPFSWILHPSFCYVGALRIVEARDSPLSVVRVYSSNSFRLGSSQSLLVAIQRGGWIFSISL